METVKTLLLGGTVVTMNEQFDVFEDGAVAINGHQIVAVGTRQDIVARYEADEVIECDGKFILPGLINAHTHVPMTLLRGLADDLRLDVWLMGYVMPTEREFVSEEFCRLGTKIGCAEMIRSGITAFADMYYHEAIIAETTAQIGMRGVLGQTILRFPSPDSESYEHALAYTRKYIEEWRNHPLITPAVAPHAPYSSTKDMLKQCAQLAMQYDVPVLIHISEMKQEEDDSFDQYGMRVVPWVKSSGLLNAKVLAAHCVHINKGDMQTLYESDTTVSHNPTSNLKLASGIAPVNEMLENKLTVGIGTDGPASNNDLDMFEEMRLAAILAKTAANDPTALPARQALLMATRMGAQALFLGDVTGSLEVGKYADLIVVDADTLHNSPKFKRNTDAVYSQIIYSTKSTDVAHVMCHGEWLMKNRDLLTIDVPHLLEEARLYAEKVDAFLIAHEGDVLKKLIAVGGVERTESFEVQVKVRITDPEIVQKLLKTYEVEILRETHYHQYDTFFLFDAPEMGRVRYREDDKMDEKGNVAEVRARLTYTSPNKERSFNSAILLSRSRFIAPADRPLRFYREYFQAATVVNLSKDRRRWRILYQDVVYFINLDRMLDTDSNEMFLEIKSRTWSLSDAEHKADGIQRMLSVLGIAPEDFVYKDYLEIYQEGVVG
ncbi:MAG: amidohydrolase family protein [Phototrophicales bacterium]|nr:amidohydrolase family protein [Phototrophicales bacterium]